MSYEQLKLENQLCFPVYAVSRLFTKAYQPELDRLGITYPQYLVMMILWETNGISVNEIAKKLILKTNTITPLLKRMEKLGLIIRQRSSSDERKVLIRLSAEGRKMEEQAAQIPKKLYEELLDGPLGIDELLDLKQKLDHIIAQLKDKVEYHDQAMEPH
ncbi:MarR family winged helix-turn-helix transcriptional regulator [Roseimarinus sediminis]|uniref:MarR family winged helix-turn-helix transcriptional regulator n=1 Tax=Roseimarinus sediminis TaxID=1610899 RepID=UPI003D1C42C3